MVNNVCIIIRHPLADERFTLGLRNALATQMGGYETALVFIGDGILSLTGAMPAYLSKTLASYLENEGALYYLKEDFEDLKLGRDDISLEGAQAIASDDLAEILEDSDTISIF
ncbi:MAG: DsrE family protein [Proteobacteria bacterium]|nr:DsrE family protein [Pseudomonadota bacterium]